MRTVTCCTSCGNLMEGRAECGSCIAEREENDKRISDLESRLRDAEPGAAELRQVVEWAFKHARELNESTGGVNLENLCRQALTSTAGQELLAELERLRNKSAAPGLVAAVDECQRMRRQATASGYSKAYIVALDEALIFLRAMLSRAERGEYLHPTSEVMDGTAQAALLKERSRG